MYTATLISDVKDKKIRRRIIGISFTDGSETFEKDFQFSLEESITNMKKKVRAYLDEINFVPEDITGEIADYTEPTEKTPTQAELAETEWQSNLVKLKEVQELIDLGVLVGNETPVTNLRNKVKADFKPAYIA